ncbi:TetR/AcrR family transcriptional regulator [Nocardia cyriacigeorgica]|uniref:TetR family transcriptional regulator n=1 Tax=Nocardia cyriacigeorgica TaxID=135487 RepID=A0A5R8NL79_9NOCA|nr:TetR family transcriptional regulator [Nocardia cyriacigeorgica]TLF75357.1 TetR family transcriptional regulator [Nocardia cyriacigeorgica]
MAEDRRQRRDAAANKQRILAAANAAFRADGMAVDMRAVAAAAGVGIGTLYRHFPTREHLVQAVTGSGFAELAEAALPEQLSALEALRKFFTGALTNVTANKAMADLLAGGSPSDAELQRCLAHLTEIGRVALARSRTDHSLADDVSAEDIGYQLLGLIRIVQLMPDAAPSVVEHQVDLALRGLAEG